MKLNSAMMAGLVAVRLAGVSDSSAAETSSSKHTITLAAVTRWADENRAAAHAFWSQSGVSIADPLLEHLWQRL